MKVKQGMLKNLCKVAPSDTWNLRSLLELKALNIHIQTWIQRLCTRFFLFFSPILWLILNLKKKITNFFFHLFSKYFIGIVQKFTKEEERQLLWSSFFFFFFPFLLIFFFPLWHKLLLSKTKFSQIWLKTKDESATFRDSSIFGYLLKPDVKYEPTNVIKRKSKFDNEEPTKSLICCI